MLKGMQTNICSEKSCRSCVFNLKSIGGLKGFHKLPQIVCKIVYKCVWAFFVGRESGVVITFSKGWGKTKQKKSEPQIYIQIVKLHFFYHLCYKTNKTRRFVSLLRVWLNIPGCVVWYREREIGDVMGMTAAEEASTFLSIK